MVAASSTTIHPLVNEIRGLLSEYGIVLPQGMSKFRTWVVRQLEAVQAKLTPLSTEIFWPLYDEFLALEKPHSPELRGSASQPLIESLPR